MKIRLRNGIDLHSQGLHGWLSLGSIYVPLSVEQYSSDEIGFRVASEDGGQPVVFRAALFELIDGGIPKSWKVISLGPNGMHLGPEPFGRREFWEKYFDGDPLIRDEYCRARDEVIADS